MPVALGHTGVAALITPRANALGGLGLDQLLEHELHGLANQPSAHGFTNPHNFAARALLVT